MADSDPFLRNRFLDLYRRSFRNHMYCFTDFLTPEERSLLLNLVKSGGIPADELTLFGGYEGAERVAARFGSPSDLGYEEDFPIAVLRISPLQEKFSDSLTHRDFLGALMHLGIERDTLGDIRVLGTDAWICVLEGMADFIMENLGKVRHTSVRVERAGEDLEIPPLQFEDLQVFLPSERLDALAARLTGLARGKVPELFRAGRVSLNGRVQEKTSTALKEGDVISIRGKGKYIYDGVLRSTKKDNLVVKLRRYI